MPELKQIEKGKWYLCTRPKKIKCRKGYGKYPMSRGAKARAKEIPILLLRNYDEIIEVKKESKIIPHFYKGHYYEYTKIGIIIVKEVPCNNRKDGRKIIDKNRAKCYSWCNKAINKYEKLINELNKENKDINKLINSLQDFYSRIIY